MTERTRPALTRMAGRYGYSKRQLTKSRSVGMMGTLAARSSKREAAEQDTGYSERQLTESLKRVECEARCNAALNRRTPRR
ncbi:hypothetical protein CPT_Paku_003 [Burkholderia phage Paku]|uniref:Uncharacterized protein n=1 Tax=Burkholderia phage Paku TaxID=2859650 RepID=A0AAE7WMY7_9CAUD|nr:hypothetical protein CPT_Paku_003 [Burkholderia phage Paku]